MSRTDPGRRPKIAPPPGQRRAIATFQPGWSAVALGTGFMVAVLMLFGVLRGMRDPAELVLIASAITVPLAWLWSRTQVAAGAGWLSSRNMLGRRRWVRTDQVVKVTELNTYTGMLLYLRDDEGHKVCVESNDLAGNPLLLRQVQADLSTAIDRGLQLSSLARHGLQLDGSAQPKRNKRGRKR